MLYSLGAPIQRGRNFFRGHLDCEEVSLAAEYFPAGWSPLVDALGKVIPLAPLLRTRSVEAFGICRSSWTLYNQKPLSGIMGTGGILLAFADQFSVLMGPSEKVIPPPFQEAWKAFIDDLSKAKPSADKLDKHIQKLVPLFACSTFQIPLRVVSPFEALKLSGLEFHWRHNSLQDAEYMPDNLIRDMCGNSFNASLVCSALGKTSALLDWINEDAEQQMDVMLRRLHRKRTLMPYMLTFSVRLSASPPENTRTSSYQSRELSLTYLSRDESADVIYFGVPSAKMILLVRQTPQTAVDVWVVGASAYATGMNTTVAVRMLRPFPVPQGRCQGKVKVSEVRLVEVHVSIYELDASFDSGRTYMVAVPTGPPLRSSMCGCELMATLRMELSGALAASLALVSWSNLDCFFFARSCLGKVPGRAPFSQLSKRATACTIRMQIVKQINETKTN